MDKQQTLTFNQDNIAEFRASHGRVASFGDERHRVTAEVLPDPHRAEVYATQASRYPGFAGYQEKTSRPIPVIALTLQR